VTPGVLDSEAGAATAPDTGTAAAGGPAAAPERRLDRLAAAALAGIPALLFARALLPGRVLSAADIALTTVPWAATAPGAVPANPLLSDIAYLFHPFFVYASTELAAGRFPLWNPYAFTGVPFFANPQTALLYPPHALAWLLPLPTALALIAIVKLAVAGLGMYWFLRQLAVAPGPALLGALAFQLNGVLATWLQWSVASAAAVVPLLFALTEHLTRRLDGRATAWLALAVACLVLAGYPQTIVLGLVAAGAWALVRARATPSPVGFLARWGAAWAAGIAVAGVQLVPFVEYARQSAVFAYRAEWMWRMTRPLRTAIAFLMPYYYGSPTSGDFWGPLNFNELATSVGVVPLIAVPLAFFAGRLRVAALFFVVMAALAGAMVYGVPGLGPALAGLPPLSMVITTRLALLLVLALSVAAALGLDGVRAAASRRAALAVRLTFAALAVGALVVVLDDHGTASRLSTRFSLLAQYAVFLALFTAASLLVLGLLRQPASTWRWLALAGVQVASTAPVFLTYNPVIETARFYPGPLPVIRHLQESQQRHGGRVMFAGDELQLAPLFRLHEVAGYDGMTPRRLEQLADPEGSLDSQASGMFRVTVPFGSTVFDLLGIHRIVVKPDRTDLPLAAEYRGPDGLVLVNPHPLPRAFLAARARGCLAEPEALRLLHAGHLDVRQEIVIDGCEDVPATGPIGDGAGASIASSEADRVVVRTTVDAPAWLVLTDTWFPGWEARVDGRASRIWRANHAFRAVWLPAGAREVEFAYRPVSLRYGLGLSAAGLLAVAGLAWWPAPRTTAPGRGR
jgi:hypothetical protein